VFGYALLVLYRERERARTLRQWSGLAHARGTDRGYLPARRAFPGWAL